MGKIRTVVRAHRRAPSARERADGVDNYGLRTCQSAEAGALPAQSGVTTKVTVAVKSSSGKSGDDEEYWLT